MSKQPGRWDIRDFTGGLNTRVDDNLIEDNEASDLKNVKVTRIGSLENRPGYQAINNALALPGPVTGLDSFYLGAVRKILAAADGRLYFSTGGIFTEINSGWSASERVHFETLVNFAVAFNGEDPPVKYDGTNATALQNAPEGRFPTLFKEKLFVVPTYDEGEPIEDQSSIWWSDTFAPESWPAVNFWDVKKGDGDRITALYVFQDELMIFKQNSMHRLRGSSLDNFSLIQANGSVGAVSHDTVIFANNLLYFLAPQGVYRWNGATAINISDDKILNTWRKVNRTHLHKAVSGTIDDMIWFAVPYDGSTENNLILIFDTKLQTWWIYDIPIRAITMFDDGVAGPILYFGDGDGLVHQYGEVYNDNGTAITSLWQGKSFDLGAPENLKKIRKAFVTDSPSASNIDISLKFDYGVTEYTLAEVAASDLLREYRAYSAPYWRYMQPIFKHNTINESFEVRGFVLDYAAKTSPKVGSKGDD